MQLEMISGHPAFLQAGSEGVKWKERKQGK
jgi:hypothetical protein